MTDPIVGNRIDDQRGPDVVASDFTPAWSLYVAYRLKFYPSSRTLLKVPSAPI